MERHCVARLIGAPPGYIGYDEGGQLTEAVRRHPYCVILFDEFEKAHQDVANVLLQLLDDGRLTDSQGRTVDFKNTVVIMTSNIGSDHLLEASMLGGQISKSAREAVLADLKAHCRPEFLNRVDDIVIFQPLGIAQIQRIVDLMLEAIGKRLQERHITVEMTSSARVYIAQQGYDPVYGARPLRRYLQRAVETKLARALIAGEANDGDHIVIDIENNELTVRPRV